MSILVVDDDAISRNILVSILEKNSLIVEAKESAAEALAFLSSGESCDLIISDVIMPVMDGFTLARKIKGDKRYHYIPIILCTALNNKAAIVKGIAAGIADYILKPVNETILIPKIKEILAKNPGALMVVDDEELMRNVLVRLFQREGYPVVAAESGKAALELLDKTKISVILSDIVMPEMDGFALLSHVKEINSDIRIILISGRDKLTREEIISAGADGFIAKPFRNTEIIPLVRSMFNRGAVL